MPHSKIAAVSMVKNECDIIELFLRINLRHIDQIVVLDHLSDDGTAEIIKALQAENLSISYTHWPEPSFRQAAAMTSAVRQIANKDIVDHILLLDADEFLISDDRATSPKNVIRAHVAPDQVGLIPWKTYCPVSGDFFGAQAPLYENFHARRSEPHQFYKAVIGNAFAKNCTVGEGNHLAVNSAFPGAPVILPLTLQHVPVRSAAQITRKVVLGSHTMAMKKNRKHDEALHWDAMANFIREKKFQITPADLTHLALRYAAQQNDAVDEKLAEHGVRIGDAGDVIKFKSLANINLTASFDSYISGLIAKLKPV